MGHRFESCWAHHSKIIFYMNKTIIKSTETGIEKICDILRKNDKILEVVLENTTIKIVLKKKLFLVIIQYQKKRILLPLKKRVGK